MDATRNEAVSNVARSDAPRVGFVGLGNMGGPMARNLLWAGFGVTVFNRSRAKAEALGSDGAVAASSLAEVAEYSDVVLACLPNVAASLGVFLGPDGLIASGRAGQVFADHSTVDPATSRRIYAAARERGIDFLDAPISGGPEGAKAATLSILVGGGASAFERARQVFAALGKTVVHLGPSGAGTVAKLANQLLVGVHTLASCEALAMARKAGVDIEQLLFVLSRSWGASRMLERNGPYIAERRFDSTGSPLRNLLKDLALVAALGEELGLNLRAASSARDVFAELAQLGWGERDITAAAMLVDGQSRTSTCREP